MKGSTMGNCAGCFYDIIDACMVVKRMIHNTNIKTIVEVKAIADYVAESNDADGVARFIEQCLWKEQ